MNPTTPARQVPHSALPTTNTVRRGAYDACEGVLITEDGRFVVDGVTLDICPKVCYIETPVQPAVPAHQDHTPA